jgi:Short C-terminal domain/Domain of unknown function (DUF4429)
VAKQQPLPPGTTIAEGVDGSVAFDGVFVTIKHKWNAAAGRGESRYPIGSVTGVEFKPGVLSGLFTLVVSGGVQRGDAKKSRKTDPLSVKVGSNHRDAFTAMRDAILQILAERDAPRGAVQQPAPAGIGDQLTQLAALHASGALTDAEFAAAKQQLLGQPEIGPQDQAPTAQAW